MTLFSRPECNTESERCKIFRMGEQIDGLRKRGQTWELEFRHKGKRHYYRIGKVSKSVAQRVARAYRGDVAKSEVGIEPDAADPITLGEARETFLDRQRVRVGAGKLSPLTLRDYEGDLAMLVKHLGEDRALNTITAKDLDGYRKARAPLLGGFPD